MPRPLSLLIHLLCITVLVAARPAAAAPPPAPTALTDDAQEDISPAQEQAMLADIRRNVEVLRSQGQLAAPNAAAQAVTYAFPLRLAPGLPDYAGFRVSAFSDHNPASGQVLDYNGGARTYDGHQGTDYALWPFGWNKLDGGEMQVIAAAAGTIVNKSDTDLTDHNCNVSSGDNWNYVALAHADGRLTIYGHMRHNSLTAKAVGQTVAQGEYLGTAASSGNSSGPHLHFEVRYGGWTNAEWMDPYAGPNSQPASLWASQRPYYDSAINKVATHSAPPSSPDPCQPSTTHLQDSFTTPATIYFYTYYRDYQGGLITQFKIYRPDGSVFQAWQDVPSDSTFYSAASRAAAFAFSASDPAGTWRFEAAYNGQLYQTYFNVNAPPAVTVSSPNGGEQWAQSLGHSVTWTDNLGGEVNIALYRNGVYNTALAYNTPSDGDFLWVPDSQLALGPGYTIRVTSVMNPAVYDASDAAFTLTAAHLAALDDRAMTSLDTPVMIDSVGNDLKPNGDPVTITALGPPISGTVGVLNAQLLYTPTTGFLGTDVFTYTVRTNTEQATASVTVLVVPHVSRVFLPALQR